MNRLFVALTLLAIALACPRVGDVDESDVDAGFSPGADAGNGEGEGEGEGEGDAGEGEGEGEADAGVGEGEGEGEGEGGYGVYDVDGADVVSTVDLDVVTDLGHTFGVRVFLPSSPGPHPVVSMSPGLLQPAVAYTTHGTRLASHGIVMIARDDPGLDTETPEVIDDLVYVITVWLPAQNADPASPLFGVADLTRIGLAGHSRGGKATLLAAEHSLHGQVLGWFGLDPVDNIALAGGQFAITDVASVGIPVVFLGAQVASTCTPENTTADTLYPAAASPAVKIIGLGAGHTQLEDQAGCHICGFCTPSGTADTNVVLRYTVRYLAAFFGRVLLDDTSVGDAFEGAGVASDVADAFVTVDSK